MVLLKFCGRLRLGVMLIIIIIMHALSVGIHYYGELRFWRPSLQEISHNLGAGYSNLHLVLHIVLLFQIVVAGGRQLSQKRQHLFLQK